MNSVIKHVIVYVLFHAKVLLNAQHVQLQSRAGYTVVPAAAELAELAKLAELAESHILAEYLAP